MDFEDCSRYKNMMLSCIDVFYLLEVFCLVEKIENQKIEIECYYELCNDGCYENIQEKYLF